MRTFQTTIDADYLPELDALADTIRDRSDVAFVEVRHGGLNVITAKGQTFRSVHYLENDSIRWVCYVE